MAQRRLERVGHLVQAELARLLLTSAKDPRLQAVNITGVRMSADLKHAWVYFRTLAVDPSGHDATRKALERAAPFLRGEVGRALGTRSVPDLRFEYDQTPDTARRLDDLLRPSHPAAAPHEDDDEPEDEPS